MSFSTRQEMKIVCNTHDDGACVIEHHVQLLKYGTNHYAIELTPGYTDCQLCVVMVNQELPEQKDDL